MKEEGSKQLEKTSTSVKISILANFSPIGHYSDNDFIIVALKRKIENKGCAREG